MEEKQQKQAGAGQEDEKMLADKQAANTLWSVMRHSGYYRAQYAKYLRLIHTFPQVEQVYVCMITGVPDAKIGEILKDKSISEEEKAGALEALWKQGLGKPVMPSEEQDRELKALREYIQRLEIEVTRTQADVSRIATEQRGGGVIMVHKGDVQEENPKPRRRAGTGGSPFKEASGNAAGRLQMEKLENEIKGLEKTVEGQKEKIARLEEEGTQVRGIVLTPPKGKGLLARYRSKKRLAGERERIESLICAGYEAEQLDFLLSCREEGIPWETIKLFSGKELPATLMKKLKDYYLKNEKDSVPDSGTQEGAQDG